MRLANNVIDRRERTPLPWFLTGKVGRGGDFGPNSHGTPEPMSFAPGTTVSEAMRAAGMDYLIEKYPTAYIKPGADGAPTAYPDGYARLVRPPLPGSNKDIVLGEPVSPKFNFLQNMELAAMLDPIVKDWPTRAVGEFGDGTTVYVALDAGESSIGGDDMHDYFVVSDIRDGGHTATVSFFTWRLVCTNGLKVITSASNIKIPHRANLRSEADFYIRFMARMHGVQVAAHETLNRLAARVVTVEEAKAIIAAAHPIPQRNDKLAIFDQVRGDQAGSELSKDEVKRRMARFQELEQHATASGNKGYDELQADWERERDRAIAHQGEVFELYQAEVDAHQGIGTAFLVVQAAVEYADWRQREIGEPTESLAESTLFGARQKEKTRALVAAERKLVGSRR